MESEKHSINSPKSNWESPLFGLWNVPYQSSDGLFCSFNWCHLHLSLRGSLWEGWFHWILLGRVGRSERNCLLVTISVPSVGEVWLDWYPLPVLYHSYITSTLLFSDLCQLNLIIRLLMLTADHGPRESTGYRKRGNPTIKFTSWSCYTVI